MGNLKASENFCVTFFKEKNNYVDSIQFGFTDKNSENFTQYENMHIVFIVADGSGTVETDYEKFVLKSHDAFIVRPQELIIRTADKNNPWQMYFFTFSGEFAEYLIEKTAFADNNVLNLNDTAFEAIVKFINDQKDKGKQTIFESSKSLVTLLSNFEPNRVTVVSGSGTDVYSQKQKYVFYIKKYINMNYSKKIKVTDISAQLNINRSHLYRIFKEETGISIESYLIQVRINKACELLLNTEFSAKKIAEKVGYEEYSTFLSNFKRLMGSSPIRFRDKFIDVK